MTRPIQLTPGWILFKRKVAWPCSGEMPVQFGDLVESHGVVPKESREKLAERLYGAEIARRVFAKRRT